MVFTTLAGATLALEQALARTCRRFCWPVLFGRFTCDDLRILTSHRDSVRISVLERDVRREPSGDLCEIILLVEGGGDNFDCYIEQDPVETVLNAGNYWGGLWHGEINFAGVQAWERFEGYVVGPIGVLNKEYGWTAAASVVGNFAGATARRVPVFVELKKSGPNLIVAPGAVPITEGGANIDYPLSAVIASMENPVDMAASGSLPCNGFSFGGGNTTFASYDTNAAAYGEIVGAHVGWNKTVAPLRVYAVLVSRFE